MRPSASMRETYGRTLAELGEEHPEIVVLDADLSTSTHTSLFARKFPERFFNVGVAEANLMGVAAGLASCGKLPFVSTFSVFATEKGLSQFKQSIAYPNLNVKVVVTHGGLSVGEDGASHFCLWDLAVMRSLPRTTVIVPADAVETEEAVRALVDHRGPAFLRLPRAKTGLVYGEGYTYRGEKLEFRIGESVVLEEGEDATVLAIGPLVVEALEASEALRKEGLRVGVIDVHTLKPLDERTILREASRTGCLVTAEDHSIIGGLGGAVAELLAERRPTPMKRVGVRDEFGKSGPWRELYEAYGLTSRHIQQAVREVREMVR
ncbi:MAG: transketolase family protein [Candidatus Hadarchaeales archaeon]